MSQVNTVDPAFKEAGKKDGVEIWRIENFKPVLIPKSEHGVFNKGDSYVVLQTKGSAKNFSYRGYFWLGSESSADEQGAAAFKIVELDNNFEGKLIQRREIQGSESDEFKSLFRESGLRIADKNIQSGFKKVEAAVYDPVLYLIKGEIDPRVTKVDVKAQSLCKGDVFILDTDVKIYVWVGKQSSKKERVKGIDIAQWIRTNSHNGKVPVVILEDEGKNDTNDENLFWKYLGGKPATIRSAAEGGDDYNHEQTIKRSVKLQKLTEQLVFLDLGVSPLKTSLIDSENVYFLQTGKDYFVWVGKKASFFKGKNIFQLIETALLQSKKQVIEDPRLDEKMKKEKRDEIVKNLNSIPLSIEKDGQESLLFRECFVDWTRPKVPFPTQNVSSTGKTTEKLVQQKLKLPVDRMGDKDIISATYATTRQQQAANAALNADEKSRKVCVYRIENMTLVPVDEQQYGIFYDGDSYIVTSEFNADGRKMSLIYMWQGDFSSVDEKGASALLTGDISKKLLCPPVQIRVEQGWETKDFISLFDGGFVVRKGGVASGFKNTNEQTETRENSLLRVHGTCKQNTRAFETDCLCKSLSSRDVFVLVTSGQVYVWNGKYALPTEVESGLLVANKLANGRNIVSLDEDKNDNDNQFWGYLGGKGEYARDVELVETAEGVSEEEMEARLFNIKFYMGVFHATEICNFEQENLEATEVNVLDGYDVIYVWLGRSVSADLKGQAFSLANDYVKEKDEKKRASAGLDKVQGKVKASTPIVIVNDGEEPASFTSHFPQWDQNLKPKMSDSEALEVDQYELKKQQLLKNDEAAKNKSVNAQSGLKAVDPSEKEREKAQKDALLRQMEEERERQKAAESAAFQDPYAKRLAEQKEQYNNRSSEQLHDKNLKPSLVKRDNSNYITSSDSPYIPSDANKKEQKLNDDEFKKVFGMTKTEFYKLQQWKQNELKKKHNLF